MKNITAVSLLNSFSKLKFFCKISPNISNSILIISNVTREFVEFLRWLSNEYKNLSEKLSLFYKF